MNSQLQPIAHQPYVKEGYKKLSEETKGEKQVQAFFISKIGENQNTKQLISCHVENPLDKKKPYHSVH